MSSRAAALRVSTRVLMVKYPLARGETRLLGVIAEKATETVARRPEDFKPTGVTSEATRYLGPVANDPRGLIQRVEIDALLTDRHGPMIAACSRPSANSST